eukprot:9240275-Lingulodinium_polyedra.AAC.1
MRVHPLLAGSAEGLGLLSCAQQRLMWSHWLGQMNESRRHCARRLKSSSLASLSHRIKSPSQVVVSSHPVFVSSRRLTAPSLCLDLSSSSRVPW